MEWSGFAPFCVEAGAMTFAASAGAGVTKDLGAGSSCHPQNARQLVGTNQGLGEDESTPLLLPSTRSLFDCVCTHSSEERLFFPFLLFFSFFLFIFFYSAPFCSSLLFVIVVPFLPVRCPSSRLANSRPSHPTPLLPLLSFISCFSSIY